MKKFTLALVFSVTTIALSLGQCPSNCFNSNTFLGYNVGLGAFGNFNVFVGSEAGKSNTSGESNTFLGEGAGLNNTFGNFNTFIGRSAGRVNTSGNRNTFLGRDAGLFNESGSRNTFLGEEAGFDNRTGELNTFIGHSAGRQNQAGSRNIFLGYQAGFGEIGSDKLYIANSGTVEPLIYGEFDNNLLRINGKLEVTGGIEGLTGLLGATDEANTFLGVRAGDSLLSGNKNVFIGLESGKDNNAINNTFIGALSGRANKGSNNTFIGQGSGGLNQNGSGNVFLGYQSGLNEQGSNKLYIDNNNTASPLIYGDFNTNVVALNGQLGVGIQNPERPIHLRATNAIFRIDRDRDDPGFAIVRYDNGFNNVWKSFYFYTKGTGINQGKFIIADWATNVSGPSTPRFVIANDGNVGIGDFLFTNPSQKLTVSGNVLATGSFITSDKRFKKDIQTIPSAMDRLGKINGVSYSYETQKFAERGLPEGQNLGLIAQEVEKVFPELVVEDAEGYKAVNYDGLIPVLIEALKSQDARIKYLESRLATNQANNTKVEDLQEAQLFQNKPNPFDRSTVIPYYLPEGVSRATLIITDLQGKELSRQVLDKRGEGSITLQAGSLSNGLYLYTLVVDGELLDTKRMLIEQ
ncbi:MAG: tail fiber domain-containing protein [Microscillaceae bacterium]|nr:tail fiber domain-containing protein [Microscillaceae bacterium]